ncbi:hypothetical protein ACM15_19885 [Parabacteroides goldsteinii]|nr:hypothetical protein ACM15_19885 [Parabacteroides goldsteinii]
MLDTIRNIISFIATFLIISSVSILFLKYIVSLFVHKYDYKYTGYKIILIGVIIALALMPFYYFPC